MLCSNAAAYSLNLTTMKSEAGEDRAASQLAHCREAWASTRLRRRAPHQLAVSSSTGVERARVAVEGSDLLGGEEFDVLGARRRRRPRRRPEGEQLGEDEEPDRGSPARRGPCVCTGPPAGMGIRRSGDGIHAAQSGQKGAGLTVVVGGIRSCSARRRQPAPGDVDHAVGEAPFVVEPHHPG